MQSKEKRILISIFTAFFFLSSLLIYLMIKKDLNKESRRSSFQINDTRQENIWPKVEINTRQ